MPIVARVYLVAALGLLSCPAVASPTPADQPLLPKPAGRAVASQQWNDLLLKALNDDPDSAATIGEAYATGPSRDRAEAVRWLSKAANLGSAEGERELGLLLLRGQSSMRDPEQAAGLLRRAAEAGDATAQAALGVMYAYGDGVPQDWPLAVEWSRRGAEQDEPWAQANLGLFLETGRDGPAASDQAEAWYRRAADHGFALAETRLGLLYQKTASGQERAFALILRAAQQNDPVSERILALAYRDGSGVAVNQAEAVAWLERAAGHGDADAMYLLSGIHADGSGVAKSQSQAWRYLLDAAAQGHSLAAARVGIAYSEGGFGQDIDAAAAEKWLETSVSQAAREAVFDPEEPGTYRAREMAVARYRLGMLIKPVDLARGAGLLRQAAAEGCAMAGYELASMYRRGDGVPRDLATAAKLLEVAANDGVGAAAFELAKGHADGWAGPRSPIMALRWYRRAAALGHAEAWLALGRAYEEAAGVPEDPSEALTWYQLAGNAGVVTAQIRLGDVARSAEMGQARNERVALRWYQLAAEQGSAAAEERIGDLYWGGSDLVTRDRTEAVRHYGVAATRGVVSAERKIAIAFANGEGAPADDAQMLFWSRKAAQAGDPVAEALLGYAIMIGVDGTYDMVEAATWLTLATEHGRDGQWHERVATTSHEVLGRLTTAERAAYQARVGHWHAALEGE